MNGRDIRARGETPTGYRGEPQEETIRTGSLDSSTRTRDSGMLPEPARFHGEVRQREPRYVLAGIEAARRDLAIAAREGEL